MKIERSKKGYPVIWVGGGAFMNTTNGRFVLDNKKQLKEAVFMRRGSEQALALVGLKEGDVVVEIWGNRFALDYDGYSAGALRVEACRIVSFLPEDAQTEPVNFNFNDIPKSVIEGLKIYHNSDGRYFMKERQTKNGK
jgi:hypothetical protein